MKSCTLCGESKPLTDFYTVTGRNGQKYQHSRCRPCRRAQFKAWSQTDRGKEVKRAGILRREYRIDEGQYLAMAAKQAGLCAICFQPETKRAPRAEHQVVLRLSVDHDHETGLVRGLLCSSCNVGLGSFQDDPQRLEAAAAYLRRQAAKTEAAEAAAKAA